MTYQEWSRAVIRQMRTGLPDKMVLQTLKIMWHEAYAQGFADGDASRARVEAHMRGGTNAPK